MNRTFPAVRYLPPGRGLGSGDTHPQVGRPEI